MHAFKALVLALVASAATAAPFADSQLYYDNFGDFGKPLVSLVKSTYEEPVEALLPETYHTVSTLKRVEVPTYKTAIVPEAVQIPSREIVTLPREVKVPVVQNFAVPKKYQVPVYQTFTGVENIHVPSYKSVVVNEAIDVPAFKTVVVPKQVAVPTVQEAIVPETYQVRVQPKIFPKYYDEAAYPYSPIRDVVYPNFYESPLSNNFYNDYVPAKRQLVNFEYPY